MNHCEDSPSKVVPLKMSAKWWRRIQNVDSTLRRHVEEWRRIVASVRAQRSSLLGDHWYIFSFDTHGHVFLMERILWLGMKCGLHLHAHFHSRAFKSSRLNSTPLWLHIFKIKHKVHWCLSHKYCKMHREFRSWIGMISAYLRL